MSDTPDNLVLQMLRDIRRDQAEMRTILQKQDGRLAHIEQRIDEVHETMYTVAGFAMHANVRHDTVTDRLSALEQRISRLEEKA